jgi:20S proteasome subunit beta 3
MSILEYNGSALCAMAGKNCVAIASDRQFGVQQTGITNNMRRIFKMSDTMLLGMSGLGSDVMTCEQKLRMKANMYELRENRELSPRAFDNMMSTFLYSRRFGPYFIEPLIAGLEGPDHKPFLSGQDLIGCPVHTDDFIVAGTAESSLYGTCETFYKPDLGPDELFEVVAQCVMASVDRDCLSGWGVEVHILTPTQHIIKKVTGRTD